MNYGFQELTQTMEKQEQGPLKKRFKQNSGNGGFAVPAPEYNPLDEPRPLGLRLTQSPLLLDLIRRELSQSSAQKVGGQSNRIKKEPKFSVSSAEKLKASNFPASILKIGRWEYQSRYEGDLVAKCYFAKHKLVWEVLDGSLKNKIEIQWSDIMALNASYSDDSPGTLDIVLSRQPLFFRETNPQPRKHTIWQATSDFTTGHAASKHRRHYLEFPPGMLGKHFEKLMQCDPRLHFLSQKGERILDYPYFEPRISVFHDQNQHGCEFEFSAKGSTSVYSLQDSFSPLGVQSSSLKNDQDAIFNHSESYPQETPSPCSAMVAPMLEDTGIEQLKAPENFDPSDLGYHEYSMLEQGTSINPTLANEEWGNQLLIKDDGNQYSWTDVEHVLDSDDNALMSRVNSLSCLLQKDITSDLNARLDISVVEKKADYSYNIDELIYDHCVDKNYTDFQNEFHDMYGNN